MLPVTRLGKSQLPPLLHLGLQFEQTGPSLAPSASSPAEACSKPDNFTGCAPMVATGLALCTPPCPTAQRGGAHVSALRPTQHAQHGWGCSPEAWRALPGRAPVLCRAEVWKESGA